MKIDGSGSKNGSGGGGGGDSNVTPIYLFCHFFSWFYLYKDNKKCVKNPKHLAIHFSLLFVHSIFTYYCYKAREKNCMQYVSKERSKRKKNVEKKQWYANVSHLVGNINKKWQNWQGNKHAAII